jgi:hypothetical protein
VADLIASLFHIRSTLRGIVNILYRLDEPEPYILARPSNLSVLPDH